jgi:hypothetical protein
MSERGKLPFDFDAVDWDAALDEWDRGHFEPEVARDRSREDVPAEVPTAAAEAASAPRRPHAARTDWRG